jgi:hypothetical protein
VVYPAGAIVSPGVVKHLEGDRFPVGELDGTEQIGKSIPAQFRFDPRWPLEIPPPVAGSKSPRGGRQECVDCYSESLVFARRLAACFKR